MESRISENHSRRLTAVVSEGVKSRRVYRSRIRSPGAHEKVWSIVTMRSSGPEICGSEIGRKSRGGIGNVGFSIAVDELYTGLLPEIEGYTILKRFNMIDLVSQF